MLLISAILCSSFLANAQFKKGNIILGGQLFYGYNSGNQKYTNPPGYPQYDQKYNYGNITISAGKALNENTAVGINLSYLPSTSKNDNGNGNGPFYYKNNGYSVGIFYRKYKTLGKEFYLFGQTDAYYNWSDQSVKDSTGSTISTGTGWGAGFDIFPGISYRISKHFFLELTIPSLFVIQYNKSSTSDHGSSVNYNSNSQSDQFTISSSLSSNPLNALGIGFRLIL
jgi:hypothetical protein